MDPLDIRRNRPAQSNVKEPLRETASQTAGPYVHIGCLPNMVGIDGLYNRDLTSNANDSDEKSISINGQVFDGDGTVCKDIMLEFWQTGETDDFQHGIWHRAGTSLDDGTYRIETILPSPVSHDAGDTLAPFILVWVTARGINIGLQTRIYFPQFEQQNTSDPHLALVPDERRDTLLAKPGSDGNSYLFDIRLQGDGETVFFES